MSEPQKVARLDLSTSAPDADAVPTSFSEAPSKQTKRLHQLKPSAKIDLTTHGPVRPEPKEAPKPQRDSKPRPQKQGGGRPEGGRKQPSQSGRSGSGRPQGGGQSPGGRQQSAPSSGSTLADLLSADVLAKLRGE